MRITEKLDIMPSLKEFIQKNQIKCENGKVYLEVDEDLVPYWIDKNKSEIIDAVNEQDKRCIGISNLIIKKMKPNISSFFEHSGEEGKRYYNEKFGE
jgi:hypothetical protein